MKLLLHKRLAGKVSYPTPAFLGAAAFKNQHARRFPSQSGFLQGERAMEAGWARAAPASKLPWRRHDPTGDPGGAAGRAR